MKKNLAYLFVVLLLFSAPLIVRADAAPPREPPGSSILPAGETQVQMLAETVSLVVQPAEGDVTPVQVTALFAMRNQGEATESMAVRFPMENPDGMGDGYGQKPVVNQFAASVNGTPLPVAYSLEPFNDVTSDINWATFPVDFPPGQDVAISVTYTTLLSKSNDGTEQASVDYILETGEGWYGPIGSAVVTLSLPYSASPSNVYLPNEGEQQGVPAPVFVGNEVSWEWSQLEPDQSDDLNVTFVWPAQWQQIVALQAGVEQAPQDVQAAIALAEAYRSVGSERHGYVVSEPLSRLALQTIQNALAYNPSSEDLQAELVIVEVWECEYASPACSPTQIQNALQDYDSYVSTHTDWPGLATWAPAAEELQNELEPPELPTAAATEAAPTLEPTATATEAATLVPSPTLVPHPTATPEPTPTPQNTYLPVGTTPELNLWIFIGGGVLLCLVGIVAGGASIWGLIRYRNQGR